MDTPYYAAVFNGDGWSVVDTVTGDQIKWCKTEQQAVDLVDNLNPYEYFNFNEDRNQILFYN